MHKAKLIKSASSIPVVSDESINEYMEKGEILLSKLNERMFKRKDILELIGGEKNEEMMKDNHSNHLRFITSIMSIPDEEILVDTVLWVFRAYMSRGFSTNYWAAQVNAWIIVLKENLTEKSFKEIIPLYTWMSVNIPNFTIAAEESLG